MILFNFRRIATAGLSGTLVLCRLDLRWGRTGEIVDWISFPSGERSVAGAVGKRQTSAGL